MSSVSPSIHLQTKMKLKDKEREATKYKKGKLTETFLLQGYLDQSKQRSGDGGQPKQQQMLCRRGKWPVSDMRELQRWVL
jgi:hypothetical protein